MYTMYTLGINFSHHASVALLKDNEVIFFSLEERFNKIKEWGNPGAVAVKALDKIKRFTNKIDFFCGISGTSTQLQSSITYLKSSGVQVRRARMDNHYHHLFHATSAFYMSGFRQASCLIIDGSGSMFKFSEQRKTSETTSIYEFNFGNNYTCTHKYFTVGLYSGERLSGLVRNYPDVKHTPVNITEEEIQTFEDYYRSKFGPVKNIVTTTALDTGIKYYCASSKTAAKLNMASNKGCDGKMMGLSGYGNIPGASEIEVFAYQAQKELEKEFLEKIKFCKSYNVVIGGGCALNILGNSLIKKTYPNLNLFIDPIAHDATTALGAAVYNFYNTTKCTDKLIISPYAGLDYNITKNDVYECARKYSV